MMQITDRVSALHGHLNPSDGFKEAAYDHVVLGGGVIGSAAAYYLTKLAPERQRRVLLLEAQALAHSGSSSAGDSRMYRSLYSERESAEMQQAALPLWRDIEHESGQKLLHQRGILFWEERGAPAGDVAGCIDEARRTLRDLGLPHDYVQGYAVGQRWPIVARPNDHALLERAAGSIHASRACRAMVQLAMTAGLEVAEHESVVHISIPEDTVLLRTSKGRCICTRRLIICAGSWTNDVLEHLGARLNLEIWRVAWGHYKADAALHARSPMWYHLGAGGDMFYGFPPEECGEPVAKVGVDYAPADPRNRMRRMADFDWRADPASAARLDAFLKTRWKGFGPCVELSSSPYTTTSDGRFVLDRLPGRPEVALFCGGNGRAFKFAPLLGRCVAELALDREPSYDVSSFSASRVAVQVESDDQFRRPMQMIFKTL